MQQILQRWQRLAFIIYINTHLIEGSASSEKSQIRHILR